MTAGRPTSAVIHPKESPVSLSPEDEELFDELSWSQRTDWLVENLSEHGIPSQAVAMGGPCWSALVEVTVADQPRRLYLAWDDGLLWQTECPDSGEVLDCGTFPNRDHRQSADQVTQWLAANDGRLTPLPRPQQEVPVPEFYPSIDEAMGAAMAYNIRLAHGTPSPNAATATARTTDPAAALHQLADRLTETASPAEVSQLLDQVLDPKTGVLAALTEVTAAATDWARARLSFESPHHNPGFDLWVRLNGCTSMLAEINHDLRNAPQEVTARPRDPVDSRHHDFVHRRRDRDSRPTLDPERLSVLSELGAMDTYAGFKSEQAARQRAARSLSPRAGAQTTGPAISSQPPPSAAPGRSPRTR